MRNNRGANRAKKTVSKKAREKSPRTPKQELRLRSRTEAKPSVAAQELRKLVSAEAPIVFKHHDIFEAVELQSLRFRHAMVFEDCVFHDTFDATDARFDTSLVFRRCQFKKSLTLQFAKIGGTLEVGSCEIGLPHEGDRVENVDSDPFQPPPRFRSANWSGIVIKGSLEADLLRVEGSLDLGHADIRGAVNLRGANLGHGKHGGRLYMRQASVDGDFELEPWIDPDKPFLAEAKQTSINGSLSIGASIFKGRINIRGIKLAGCLHAITVHIKGRVLGDCWRHPTAKDHLPIHRTEIGIHRRDLEHHAPSVSFHDATVDEAVWLHGIKARGSLEFENSRIGGSLEIDMWPRTDRTGVATCFGAELGQNNSGESLIIKNAHIASNVRLDGSRMTGRIAGHNCTIGAAFLCRPRTYTLNGPSRPEVQTTRPEIGENHHGKSLSLYGAHISSNVEISGAKLSGGARLRYTKIGGAIIAQPWTTEDLAEDSITTPAIPTEIGQTADRGQSLYLYGAEVGGNVCFERAILDGYLSLELANIKGSVILDGSKVGIKQRLESPIGVSLAKARVDNDVSLNGVIIARSVLSASCRILGNLHLSLLKAKREFAANKATVAGVIDFTGAEVSGVFDISHCELAANTDQSGDTSIERETVKISLHGAKVSTLVAEIGHWEQLGVKVDLRGFAFTDLQISCAETKQAGKTRTILVPASVSSVEVSSSIKFLALVHALLLITLLASLKNWRFYSQFTIAALTVFLTVVAVYAVVKWREKRSFLELCKPRSSRANPYVTLLNRTPKLDISTYTTVEYWLANQGEPETADDVHYAMRQRELLLSPDELPYSRWIWKWVYFWLAGSGTKIQRLLVLHLIVFLFSWLCVFSNPGSVEHPATFVIPATYVHQTVGHPGLFNEAEDALYKWADHNGTPAGVPWAQEEQARYSRLNVKNNVANEAMNEVENWGQSDSIWVAINVQVPLLHIWARDEWEPSSHPGYWGSWFGVCSLLGMQYDTFAGLVQLFSYLTIPMMIASGGRILRRKEPS